MGVIDPINKSWCLEQICEANYQKLLQLIPLLFTIDANAVGTAKQKTTLHLRVLERNPYTLTIELNHCFHHNQRTTLAPAVIIRIYRDAKSAEVLRDHAREDLERVIKNPAHSTDIMDYKWRLNYFLTKWLDYCLRAKYEFHSEHPALLT